MTGYLDEYIPLDRTFHELAIEPSANDDVDLTSCLGTNEALRWSGNPPIFSGAQK